MTIQDKRTNEIFYYADLMTPIYGKWSFGGLDYGYIIVSHEYKIYFFACYADEVNYADVTNEFIITQNY